jgi:hypothetical protein
MNLMKILGREEAKFHPTMRLSQHNKYRRRALELEI